MTNADKLPVKRGVPTILTMTPEERAAWKLRASLKAANKREQKKRETRLEALDKNREGK